MKDKKLIVTTEATCDLADERKGDISVVPMQFTVGGDTFSTDGGKSPLECFRLMRAGALTSTGLVNEFTAYEFFARLAEAGKDILHLGFSSSLSATFENVSRAAERIRSKFQRKIAVVDTLSGSLGQGLLAEMTSKVVSDGAGIDEARQTAESLRLNICHEFVADDLFYLNRSGRLGKLTAALGNAIHMKPVMYLGDDGRFHVGKKVLSRKKSIAELADSVIANYTDLSGTIHVAHADCYEDALFLADRIEKGLGVKPVISDFGMVIGSHCGPGTLGVFYTGKKRGK